MIVMKFGGSSVNGPERIDAVMSIIKDRKKIEPAIAVVVSAMGGVTDQLIEMSSQSYQGNSTYQDSYHALVRRHLDAVRRLVPAAEQEEAIDHLSSLFEELHDALHGVSLVRELTKRSLDFIMSFGERASAYIIAKAMQPELTARYIDARTIIRTDTHFGGARIDLENTYSLIADTLGSCEDLPVITGFIGSTETGETTTLGRGGSDFTAALIGAALYADEIEIWTDVDGVMTADPRKVKRAFTIPRMTYKEALEMSYFGAKVLHPPTVAPALQRNIPLRIKNTFNPSFSGTLISHHPQGHESLICGLSSIDNIAMIRIEGAGMIGVCGIAMRLFSALAKHEINVILISQGSSEHSICIAVEPSCAAIAKDAIDSEFHLERKAGLIDPLVMETDLSVVAVVGENMRKTPGIAGRLFGALGKNGVNIIALVQGSSEYNISLVIKKEDEAKALNVIHEEFFFPDSRTVHLFLIGLGLIGKELLNQIGKQLSELHREHEIHLKLMGVANSKRMAFEANGVSIHNWEETLACSPTPMNLGHFISQMKEMKLMNSVFVDCTANQEVANAYSGILESNISIVTPNKLAASGPYEEYAHLKKLGKKKGVQFFYEANVGAGLPIIGTMIDMLKSGDKIIKIEAILSGTLSYLLNSYDGIQPLSALLKEAQQRGLTEPDPRDDLNGQDVRRKLLILARECGYALELSDVSIEPLVPQEYRESDSIEDFYRKLEAYDPLFDNKYQEAKQSGNCLRYIATLENGEAKIALRQVDTAHPFHHLAGCDNIIAFTTERYKTSPMVIQGQGAGAQVTAGEVLADILRVVS